MDRLTARRKLLRGSLSAPLVLTVASPAALARQSFEACLSRAKLSEENPAVFNAANDKWLRKRVALYSGKLSSDTSGKSLPLFRDGDRYFLKEPGTCVGYQFTGYLETAFSQLKPVEVNKQQVYELALVYVDLDGNIVNCGPCPNINAFPVTTSCWASFGGMHQL